MFSMPGSTADTAYAPVAVALEEFQPFFHLKEDFVPCVLFARAVRPWKLDIILRLFVSGTPCAVSVSLEEYTTIGFFWNRPPENVPSQDTRSCVSLRRVSE